MNKIKSIFKYEFINTVTRRSFILTLILLPVIPALVLGVLNRLSANETQNLTETLFKKAASPLPSGVVDKSGLITAFPDWLTKGQLVPIADEVTADQMIKDGKLQGFYIIAETYLEKGQIIHVKPSVNPVTDFSNEYRIEELINFNLLGSDQGLYLKFVNPVEFQVVQLNPQIADSRDTDNLFSFFIPYGVTFFFYIVILSSSSLMLTAVGKEKDNRVMEVLLSSIKPIQLFIGKITALGLAGLLQMLVWFGSAILLLRLSGRLFTIPSNLQIPAHVFFLAIPFFLLGYGIYSTLMAGIGAMAPNLREGSQSTFVIMLPLIFILVSISTLIQQPHGSLSTFLSLFPLTSPVAMMTRLSIGKVPSWQVVLSLGLLSATAFFLIRSVSNLFRAQTILAGNKFSIKDFFKAIVRPEV